MFFSRSRQRQAADSVERAQSFWSSLSQFYVDKTQLDDLRTRSIASVFVREAALRGSDEVLDAGCGHLRISMALMRLVPGISLLGVDLTQSLLDQGAQLLAERGLPPMETVCADLAKLPMPDDRFDKIVSARVFQYISDPVATLKELRRVLKPGGRLVFSVPNKLNPIKLAAYRGRLHTPAELGQWLRDAGFVDVNYGSACFIPGQLGRQWDSSWIAAEQVSKLPAVGQIGGNAWASGRKPQ
jgi:SAM-dependent methyltransferase